MADKGKVKWVIADFITQIEVLLARKANKSLPKVCIVKMHASALMYTHTHIYTHTHNQRAQQYTHNNISLFFCIICLT